VTRRYDAHDAAAALRRHGLYAMFRYAADGDDRCMMLIARELPMLLCYAGALLSLRHAIAILSHDAAYCCRLLMFA